MAGNTKREAAPPDHLFVVGRITGLWGRKGMVKVVPLTDFPERLPEKRKVWLWRAGNGAREVAVEGGRVARRNVQLKLAGVDDMSGAEALAGFLVMVDEEGLEALPQGSYYLHQLIGLEVREDDGTVLGRLEDVLRTGANDVYVVRGKDGELLIPAVREFVREVDPEGGFMVVRRPREEKR